MEAERTQIDQIAADLYRRGQLLRDGWWQRYVSKLEAMIDQYQAAEGDLDDFTRLLGQLPDPLPDPFASPPLQSSQAPPLDPSWTHPQPSDDFLADHIRRHGPPPGGGQ